MEELVSGDGLSDTNDIALDVEAGKIYWIEDGGKAIRRANLDGSNVEDVVISTMGGLKCITLDTQEGKIYWIEDGAKAILRANLDGSGVEHFVTSGMGSPERIALDVEAGKMYWTDWGSDRQR